MSGFLHVHLLYLPGFTTAYLPKCRDGGCWDGVTAPSTPSTLLPWLSSLGLEDHEANTGYGSAVTGR